MALFSNEQIVETLQAQAQSVPGVRLLLLGPLRYIYERQTVVLSGSVAPLFGYLALYASNGRVVPRGRIADTLWPSASATRAQRMLSETLYRLRRALGSAATCLQANEKMICLVGVSFDRDEFCDLAGAPDLPEWRAALELYEGDLLEDLDAEWLLSERAILRDIYLDTLARACMRLAEHGHFTDALVYAHRWTTDDPFNEDAQRAAMRLYARLGRYIAALQQYDRLVELLEDELQTSPLPETRALANTLRAEYQALPPTAQPLRPLVGRRQERALLLRLIERAQEGWGGIALLEGEAGSGKTCLLEALAEGAAWRGMRVAWGSAAPADRHIPLAPLTSALHVALEGAWGTNMAAILPTETTAALANLRPSLFGPHIQIEPAINAGSNASESNHLPAVWAIADLLRALAQARPHLLLLDNTEFADPDFWLLLKALAPYLTDQRLLIILSYRPDTIRANPIAWEILRALDCEQAMPRVTLEGLSMEECAELSNILGIPIERSALLVLYQQTGGNPALLYELLLASPCDRRPAAVCEWIQRRLAVFPVTTRAALQAAAALGSNCTHAAWPGLLAPDAPASAGLSISLARADAPFGKPLTEVDRITVRWTVDAGTPDQALLEHAGKVALRRHRILRLIGEAQAQGAAPTDADLARVLDVTQRTIEADMVALRSAGIATPTRRRM